MVTTVVCGIVTHRSMLQAANILVDMQGRWFIGDFGAAVCLHTPNPDTLVHETSIYFTEGDWVNTEAVVRYDWYMLAVLAAAELHKPTWQTKLIGTDSRGRECTPREKLTAALAEACDPHLVRVIARILAKAL